MTIDGLSPDQPVIENEMGAKQSKMPYAFHLLPPVSMFSVAKVIGDGEEKYGVGNWQCISTSDHLKHALAHIYGFLAGDRSDGHLTHAACRLLFAITTAGIEQVLQDEA